MQDASDSVQEAAAVATVLKEVVLVLVVGVLGVSQWRRSAVSWECCSC